MKRKQKYSGKRKERFGGRIQSFFRRSGKFFRKIKKTFTPDKIAWKSASIGIIIVILILLSILAILHAGKLGLLISGLSILYFSLMGAAAALGFFLFMKLFNVIPDIYKWVLAGAVVILMVLWPVTLTGKLVIIGITIISASFIGGSAGMFIAKGWKRKRPLHSILNVIFLTIGLAGIIGGTYWLLTGGEKIDMPENAALKSDYRPVHIELPDPSNKGDFDVLQIYYGSGKDKHREEFGRNTNIITDPVDGSRFVSGWDKFNGWARTKFWGFNEKSLPLNARVWYPGGKGPFPLVLVVHGNHLDRDYSDPGYEYLGRLMASRGFIFASVDENFLNSTWSDMFKSLKEENDCRAWILLKHLELWHKWNRDTVNPFYTKVDTGKIALIGHSRGGEAVAIAAALNQLPYYPDDATFEFNFGYSIRSVIAIAPVDGQYKPARTGTFFNNVNYFVLQGSHDMDMKSYHGARQFHRIKFIDNDFHIKAGLYIWGANHSQFNTVWRRNDAGYPGIALFNKAQLIPEEDQKRIAQVYISAFLEVTLNQKSDYLPLFRDYRTALDWLPETIFLNQYEDSNCEYICSFEEDINLKTTTLKTGKISTSNLTVWKESVVPLKWGEQDTRAVYVGWNIKETDSLAGNYTITIESAGELKKDNSSHLIFSIAESKESSNPHPKKGKSENKKDSGLSDSTNLDIIGEKTGDSKKVKSEDKKSEEKKDSLDLTIILKDFSNCIVQLPLSHYSYLQPQLEAKIMKADFMTKTAKSEIVFQTFFLPLADFKKLNQQFNPDAIEEISFVFDRTGGGVVVIDNIGFWKK